MDSQDEATLAAYRATIERAVRDSDARAAVEHVFAAIERRQAREKMAMAIVAEVARLFEGAEGLEYLTCPFCGAHYWGEKLPHERHEGLCPVTRARALVKGDA